MGLRRSFGCAMLLLAVAACTEATPGTTAPSTIAPTVPVTFPPTVCATSPAPQGRLVTVTLDDVVAGFGGLGLRANSDLTPGIVRIELVGHDENAEPASVTILFESVPVTTIVGVEAGETCGIDLEVGTGTYHITDGEHDVEFTVGV